MSLIAADVVSRSLLCFGMAAAFAGLVRGNAGNEHETVVFGVLDDTGELSPSHVVPLVPGQQFGWSIALNDQGVHSWREVLITPSAPLEWIGADLSIVHGGRVGITERTETAIGGTLAHAWTITDGDSAGHHLLELSLDGRVVQRMSFLVLPPR